MNKPSRSLFVVSALCFLAGPMAADLLVNSSLAMESFQITPSAGTIQGASPQFSTTACAGSSINFSIPVVSTICKNQSFTVPLQLGSADAQFGPPGAPLTFTDSLDLTDSEADTLGATEALVNMYGNLTDTFEIAGTANPVNVQFSAVLSGSYSLSTSGLATSADSVFDFSLLICRQVPFPPFNICNQTTPSVNSPFIGPNQTLSAPYNTTYMASQTLLPNTTYSVSFDETVSSEGFTSVPEPSLFLAVASGLCGLLIFYRRDRLTARLSALSAAPPPCSSSSNAPPAPECRKQSRGRRIRRHQDLSR